LAPPLYRIERLPKGSGMRKDLTWDAIVAHALTLDRTEAGLHFGKPTVKANGWALISPGREPGSFVLHTDAPTKLFLLETDPDTYWQTPHYHGFPSLLVRYDTADPERVLDMVTKSYELAMAKKPPRARAKRKK
jgi:hypothetical protein